MVLSLIVSITGVTFVLQDKKKESLANQIKEEITTTVLWSLPIKSKMGSSHPTLASQ
jgi:hypothetical protein